MGVCETAQSWMPSVPSLQTDRLSFLLVFFPLSPRGVIIISINHGKEAPSTYNELSAGPQVQMCQTPSCS